MPQERALLINEAEEKPENECAISVHHTRSYKNISITRSKKSLLFRIRLLASTQHDDCRRRASFPCRLAFIVSCIIVVFLIQFYQTETSRPGFSERFSTNVSPIRVSTYTSLKVISHHSTVSPSSESHSVPSSSLSNSSDFKPPCPLVPPKLVGRLKVIQNVTDIYAVESELFDIQIGGHYAPPNCTARDKVAIIIPYRDRPVHLTTLLANLHPMLKRQNIDYTLYIVEQIGDGSFNRAKLFNVGYFEALKHDAYNCFIFHDVDLVPEDDRNLYTCPESPRHMSVAVDKFNYRLPYKTLFGGVCALSRKQFEKVNGFSNQFWGWGGEDDDMFKRIAAQHWKIERYSPDIARYTMLKHSRQQKMNNQRFKQLKTALKRWKNDGLNSCEYKVESMTYKKLYTLIEVDLMQH